MRKHYLKIIKEKIKKFYIFKEIIMNLDLKICYLKFLNFFLNECNIIYIMGLILKILWENIKFKILFINLHNVYKFPNLIIIVIFKK